MQTLHANNRCRDSFQELCNSEMASDGIDQLKFELEQAYDSLRKLASAADEQHWHENRQDKASCDEMDHLKAELDLLR